ncbi:expressed unknown protein [Seminavis robusta]|uniref:Uncharacterized protein n=1 Tax=Seminavis robusta TaxID=568900 RepID=A0A9N8DVV6_9STRA|nr:expressed unknown protein [Seminavis robusta]|eukprot:Sro411_g137720.1 n/a (582) ;mRNA; f:47332-49077
MTHQPPRRPKRSSRSRRDSASSRQLPFWSQERPAQETAAYHDPLLDSHRRDSQHNHYRLHDRPQQSRSLIPWSPGQTIASDSPPSGMDPYIHESGDEYSVDRTMYEEADDEEDSTRCCRLPSCCCFLPFFCCCCRGCSRPTSDQEDSGRQENSRIRIRRRGVCLRLSYFVLVMLTFAALYYKSSKCTNQNWTMNVGESRHVATAGFLTDSVQVTTKTTSSSSSGDGRKKNHTIYYENNDNQTVSRGVAVYAMGSPHCPLLNGPPVTLDSPTQKLVLLPHAFEYQYFYLNKGSTMHISVHQMQGATNILVLKGNKVLSRIQDKKKNADAYDLMSDLELEFNIEQILLERFSWTQERAPIEFSFTSPANDVYVLLYDNAAMSEGATLNVKYHSVLTTYDLEGLVPWCSHASPVNPSDDDVMELSYFSCPPLQVSMAGCIIVQAIQRHPHSQNHTNDDYFQLGGDGTMEVTVNVTRQWWYISALATIPALFLALICYCRKRRQRRRLRRWRERYYRRTASRDMPQPQREEPSYQYMQLQEGGEESDGNAEGENITSEAQQLRSSSEGGNTTMIPAENVVVVSNQ